MILRHILHDTRGSTLVEFTLTLPLFIFTIFGIVQAGLLIWAQIGLQHGVDMAARCMSISTSAYLSGQINPTSCFTAYPPNATASDLVQSNISAIQQYAATQSYGLSPAPSNFAASTPACGYSVSANYPFNLLGGETVPGVLYVFSLTLSAQSCYSVPS
jgi:Flp pilus assembly protein TadG